MARKPRKPLDDASVPPKLCECGCGGYTKIALETDTKRGYVRGQRQRFVASHHRQRTLEEAFWESALPGQPGECWEWQGGIASHGYGVLSCRNRQYYAHRTSYELHKGPIPDGMNVCHSCDNTACWNPDHLFLGTDADNAADKVEKERQNKGKTVPSSKLTDEAVRQIRRLKESGLNNSEIARRFGVVRATIWHIVNGNTWKHVQ